jgi:hypothetical protein
MNVGSQHLRSSPAPPPRSPDEVVRNRLRQAEKRPASTSSARNNSRLRSRPCGPPDRNRRSRQRPCVALEQVNLSDGQGRAQESRASVPPAFQREMTSKYPSTRTRSLASDRFLCLPDPEQVAPLMNTAVTGEFRYFASPSPITAAAERDRRGPRRLDRKHDAPGAVLGLPSSRTEADPPARAISRGTPALSSAFRRPVPLVSCEPSAKVLRSPLGFPFFQGIAGSLPART